MTRSGSYSAGMSWASSDGSRRSMQSNRHRDTGPELAVRRLLHAAGLRYRVDVAPLGGRRRADIVFTRQKIAVFIDGCFWHNCPLHGTTPKRNDDYWLPKLARNKERDSETNLLLQGSGWTVLRYWEHQDALEVSNQIIGAVRRPHHQHDLPGTPLR
jgi:DNA mismatch endonuclease (patch repair protein)